LSAVVVELMAWRRAPAVVAKRAAGRGALLVARVGGASALVGRRRAPGAEQRAGALASTSHLEADHSPGVTPRNLMALSRAGDERTLKLPLEAVQALKHQRAKARGPFVWHSRTGRPLQRRNVSKAFDWAQIGLKDSDQLNLHRTLPPP
jgi:hypothetical protein